jgi:hypothetical protein
LADNGSVAEVHALPWSHAQPDRWAQLLDHQRLAAALAFLQTHFPSASLSAHAGMLHAPVDPLQLALHPAGAAKGSLSESGAESSDLQRWDQELSAGLLRELARHAHGPKPPASEQDWEQLAAAFLAVLQTAVDRRASEFLCR